jgi:ribosomal protein L11 methylase PrmA
LVVAKKPFGSQTKIVLGCLHCRTEDQDSDLVENQREKHESQLRSLGRNAEILQQRKMKTDSEGLTRALLGNKKNGSRSENRTTQNKIKKNDFSTEIQKGLQPNHIGHRPASLI